MNRLQLYRQLRRHVKLSEKRSPALEQGKVAKVMMYVGAILMMAYLIFLGSLFGKLAAEEDELTVLLVLMPFLLVIDFLLRFVAQQTPLVYVKPYMLLPMPVMSVVESYLGAMLTNGYNFSWLALFLPYAYITLVAGAELWGVVAIVIVGLLMVMVNSQWYLLVRTLIVRPLLWWLLPLAVYAALLLPLFLGGDGPLEYLDSFDTTPMLWLLALLMLAVLVALLAVNRRVLFRFVYQELARGEKKATAIKHVSQFTFLECFGQVGEYLKLELKSIMRNKAIRSRVFMSLGLIVMLSAIISYTDIYDGFWIRNFWCYYCFAIYGMTTLTKVMGPEGNYIDLLMTQRENILSLLRAKYIFHVAILVVPLLVMLPAVFAGKFTIMMMLAYLLLTSGLGYAIMFQLAVYNKQTLPLDQKMTGKNNVESGFQLAIEMVGMFLPLLLVGGMLALTDEDTAYALLALLGLLLTAAHPLWLRSIYRRMMVRRYANLEGFHASR